MSPWRVNAFNPNIDGTRKQHFEQARKIFLVRFKIAENTLAEPDPKFVFYHEAIRLTET